MKSKKNNIIAFRIDDSTLIALYTIIQKENELNKKELKKSDVVRFALEDYVKNKTKG